MADETKIIHVNTGTTDQWNSQVRTLEVGEPAYDRTTGDLAIGDGIKSFAQLPKFTRDGLTKVTANGVSITGGEVNVNEGEGIKITSNNISRILEIAGINATMKQKGIIQIADEKEVLEGFSNDKAVTPHTLRKALTDTDWTPPGTAGSVEFTTPGIYVWEVPAGITQIRVTACGGGGGGVAGRGGSSNSGGGSGGGGAAAIANASYTVTPGEVISVTVGSGGAAGSGSGSATTISNIVTLPGGKLGGASGGAGGGAGGAGTSNDSIMPVSGTDGVLGTGGSAGSSYIVRTNGGGGGGSLGGGGGGGGYLSAGNGGVSSLMVNGVAANGENAIYGSPVDGGAGSFGAGGGGGSSGNPKGGKGGKGGSGFVRIEWGG